MSANTGGVGRAIVIGCACLAVAHVVVALFSVFLTRYELTAFAKPADSYGHYAYRIDHWTGETYRSSWRGDWHPIDEP